MNFYGVKADRVYKAIGCKRCNNTGYIGRIPVLEYFIIDDELEESIAKGDRTTDIKKYLEKIKYKSLQLAGIDLVVGGLTTMEELGREVV
jgi:type II secretory ATPase GspE/PulE/Tfp pilus assembly ATPase PilB-like protein